MTEHNEDTVERVAKAINGPHDPTHIGADKLRELQDYRWEHQTETQDKGFKIHQARAALRALSEKTHEQSTTRKTGRPCY